MDNLTSRQLELLEWLENFIGDKGFAPSIREQMQGMKVKSPAPIQSLLNALKDKGFITWQRGKSRSIQILKPTIKGVPILGHIGASDLLETFVEDEVEYLPRELFEAFGKKRSEISKYFAVRVRGDSMKDSAILPGDIVVLKPPATSTIKNGTVVAARVQSKTTLKHYHRVDDERVKLCPANPQYSPIEVTASELQIQGVYESLLRGLC